MKMYEMTINNKKYVQRVKMGIIRGRIKECR